MKYVDIASIGNVLGRKFVKHSLESMQLQDVTQ